MARPRFHTAARKSSEGSFPTTGLLMTEIGRFVSRIALIRVWRPTRSQMASPSDSSRKRTMILSGGLVAIRPHSRE